MSNPDSAKNFTDEAPSLQDFIHLLLFTLSHDVPQRSTDQERLARILEQKCPHMTALMAVPPLPVLYEQRLGGKGN